MELKLGEICYLSKPKHINDKKLPYLEVKYLRKQVPCKYKEEGLFISSGTSIILVDGENSGEIFHTQENGYMGSTFMQIIALSCVYQPYIELFITHHKNFLKNNKKGSAIPHLDKELFRNLPITLPSRKNQIKTCNLTHIVNQYLDKLKAEL